MSFTFEPVPGKPGAFRVWREGDEQPWHPDQMLERYLERKETKMIDPRNSPVAMLPILNAVAGHMIAKAAPLRVINVEDTEQMVCEACEAGGFDCDVMEEEARKCTGRFFSFFEDTQAIADMFGTMNWSAEMRMFLDTLAATIEEAV